MKGVSISGVAITVLATLLIAAVAYGAASGALHVQRTGGIHPMPPQARTTPSPTPLPVELPSPSPSPGGLFAVDQDVLDRTTAWMLVTNCPIASTCYYAVTGTLDSGRSWSHPVQVGPSFPSYDGDAPRTIRFANLLDGFVYGISGAYVTHDGGKSWQRLPVPAVFVYSIAVSGNRAWATTYPCPKGTPCQLEVRSSTDAGHTWLAPHQLPVGFSPEAPVAFPDGLIMSSVPTGDIEMTTDAGVTWRSIKSRCTGNPFSGYATTVDGVELWEACVGYPDANGAATSKSLFVSEDGGKSWSPRDATPIAGPVPESLVSNRTGVAYVASWQGSMVTRDGGKTWSELSQYGVQFTFIRFGSASGGWALDRSRSLWVTDDGGDQWTDVGSLPSRLS